jgi:hypothetical protein
MKSLVIVLVIAGFLFTGCDKEISYSGNVSDDSLPKEQAGKTDNKGSIDNAIQRLRENILPDFQADSILKKQLLDANALGEYLPQTPGNEWHQGELKEQSVSSQTGNIYLVKSEYSKNSCVVNLVLSDALNHPLMLLQYQQTITDIESGRPSDLKVFRYRNEYGLEDASQSEPIVILMVGNRLLYLFRGSESCKAEELITLAHSIPLTKLYQELSP